MKINDILFLSTTVETWIKPTNATFSGALPQLSSEALLKEFFLLTHASDEKGGKKISKDFPAQFFALFIYWQSKEEL